MELLVGCPVVKRGWILPKWFEHLERAVRDLPVSVRCVFLAGRDDDDSWDAIVKCPFPVLPIMVDEPRAEDVRQWDVDRYVRMVDIRNKLLENVRIERPDYFLSLDSDILLHPDAIKNALQTIERFDAVGLACYMTKLNLDGGAPNGSTHFPSCGFIGGLTNEGAFYRKPMETGAHHVGVIMAAKLMKPSAYSVDYVWDGCGEDIGWSRNCRKHKVRFGWDNRVVNRHVMSPIELDCVDPRVTP